MTAKQTINPQQKELAESAITEAGETIDYNTVEYPLEYFIDKISQQQIDNNLNWNESKQSYFIESLMLSLPVFNIIFFNKDSSDLFIYPTTSNYEVKNHFG